MPLTLRFQSTGTVPGSARPVTMRGASLTIGRGDENDLVLPDPDRMISKRHCVIEDHGHRVVVIDISTNGTFLNYSKTPLGSTPAELNAGDVLSLGTYELVVEMLEEPRAASPFASIPPPLDEGPVSPGRAGRAPDARTLLDDGRDPGDFLDDLLGGPSTPTGPRQLIPEDPLDVAPPLPDDDPLLGPAPDPHAGQAASESDHSPAAHDAFTPRAAHGAFIPDDWELEVDEGAHQPAPPPAAPPPTPPEAAPWPEAPEPPRRSPAPPPAAAPAPPPAAAPAPPVPAGATGDAAARAFLRAAGVEHLDIPDAELAATMARLGTVMQALIAGMREVLMTRAAIKGEFRMHQTRIGAADNNPLKFSISAEQAVEAMVRPPTRGYKDPVAAAAEALKDIRAHEVAMVSGMEAALRGLLQKLDPKALEEKIETGGGLSALLKGKKARYWEVYEKMYAEISDQAENDFQDLFSREFARAYQDQLKKL